jgi:hypothetical protein
MGILSAPLLPLENSMCRRRFDFQVFSARARLDWSGPVVGTHGIPKSDTRDLATPHKSKGQIKPIAAAPTRKILDGRLEPKDLADGVWNKRGRFAHFVPFFGVSGEQPDSAGDTNDSGIETRPHLVNHQHGT